MTRVGTGSSMLPATSDAAAQAARAACARIGKPSYGFVFAGPRHSLATAMTAVRAVVGPAEMMGCSTAGEITEAGLTHGGIAVLLVESDAVRSLAFTPSLRRDPSRAASDLSAHLDIARRSPNARDFGHLTTFVLTDGLSGTGEALVDGMRERIPMVAQIVGGAAGDEGAFEVTHVAAGDHNGRDAAAAMHVMTRTPIGVGVDHGLRPTTKPMKVTRAKGNIVYELEGRRAFDVYREHARRRGIELDQDRASPYLIGNELGIHFFNEIRRARAPLFANRDGSLTCAASVPEGAMVSILDGEPTSLLEAAASAAREAKESLNGARAAGVLLFDCVCRGMILDTQFDAEIEAVRDVFGDVPIAGFLTYGEIARYAGSLDGWHNATAVVAAIPA